MRIEKGQFIRRVLFIWFWTLSSIGFFLQQFSSSAMETLWQTINLLADATILVLAMMTLRHKWDVIVIVSYAVMSYVITCMINGLSLFTWINGSRVFFGVLFVVPVLRYIWDDRERHDEFIRALDKHLYAFLILMAITMTIQFLQYGAGDEVGGIFGAFSGIASISIYCVSFYLLRKRIDPEHLTASMWANWRYIFLLYPTFLNETKISIILIVIYFLLLVPIDRKLASRLLVILPATAIMLTIGVMIYMAVNQGRAGTDLFSDDFVMQYLMTDLEDAESASNYALDQLNSLPDVPRLAKIAFMPTIMEDNQIDPMVGLGVGMYKGGMMAEQTDFAKEYDWLIIGTSPYIFHIFMQLGIVGSVWAIAVFAGFYLFPPRLYRNRDWNIQLYFTAIVIALLIYGDLWREMCFSFIMLLFMQLSWKPSDDTAQAI